MDFYGECHYNEVWYNSSPHRAGTELSFTIRARIVKPFVEPPPVMDTIGRGLAQRFNWLQQGIQVFGLLNKIEYNRGQDLDNIWGEIYELPRLTGESDDDYRTRLMTYVKVLTGSGTTANTGVVLDSLIGLPGTSEVQSVYPAHARITWITVEAMRLAKAKSGLLDSVLPGMFAAGVTYEYLTPIQDFNIVTAIRGDATQDLFIRAAIQSEHELSFTVDALIAYGRSLDMSILAAIQANRDLAFKIKTTLRGDCTLPLLLNATIRGEPSLDLALIAAIRAEREQDLTIRGAVASDRYLSLVQRAAIARNFETYFKINAYVMMLKALDLHIIAAVQASRELSLGIRARIAKPT